MEWNSFSSHRPPCIGLGYRFGDTPGFSQHPTLPEPESWINDFTVQQNVFPDPSPRRRIPPTLSLLFPNSNTVNKLNSNPDGRQHCIHVRHNRRVHFRAIRFRPNKHNIRQPSLSSCYPLPICRYPAPLDLGPELIKIHENNIKATGGHSLDLFNQNKD